MNPHSYSGLLGLIVLAALLLLIGSMALSDREMMETWHGKSWPDNPCELQNKCR